MSVCFFADGIIFACFYGDNVLPVRNIALAVFVAALSRNGAVRLQTDKVTFFIVDVRINTDNILPIFGSVIVVGEKSLRMHNHAVPSEPDFRGVRCDSGSIFPALVIRRYGGIGNDRRSVCFKSEDIKVDKDILYICPCALYIVKKSGVAGIDQHCPVFPQAGDRM